MTRPLDLGQTFTAAGKTSGWLLNIVLRARLRRALLTSSESPTASSSPYIFLRARLRRALLINLSESFTMASKDAIGYVAYVESVTGLDFRNRSD